MPPRRCARLREGELRHRRRAGIVGPGARQFARARLRRRGHRRAPAFGIRIEPVLTAHPTEAKRLSVLDQHRAIYQLIQERERALLTPTDSKRLHAQTKAALERLWRTGEILLTKPDISDERRNVLYYLRDVFPSVLPAPRDPAPLRLGIRRVRSRAHQRPGAHAANLLRHMGGRATATAIPA